LTFADSHRIHQVIIQPEPEQFGFFILLLHNLTQILTMGMFDTITINASMLPVSEEDQKRLKDGDYQTKSLGESMQHFRITDEGILETDWDKTFWEVSDSSWDEEKQKEAEPPKENWEIVPITDAISFYTYSKDNNEVFEFVALFEEGKMLIVKRLVGFNAVRNKYKGWLEN
jgi:hypothetical protein